MVYLHIWMKFLLMHGMEHVKFINAQQARPVYKYKKQ
jgi:hypothetical protein